MTNKVKTIETLIKQFTKAKKGEKIVYHEGDLCFDRYTKAKEGIRKERADNVSGIGDYFASLEQRGLVLLVQKRLRTTFNVDKGPFVHEYIAIKL